MELIKELRGSILVLKAPEGYKITNYKECENVRNYSSFEIAYVNKNKDISDLYCIDLEADKIYLEKQKEILDAEAEAELKKMEAEQLALGL